MRGAFFSGFWLLVSGCWFLVAGCWFLVSGCWLLVAGCWLLVAGCWLLVAGCWLLVAGCWLLVAGCWLLVAGCWLLVAGCWLLVALRGIFYIGQGSIFTKDLRRMSYRKLEIWKQARELVIEIHKMSLKDLPKFETYEEGSQIRRSMKSVKSNIVEGFGRRYYKGEYIKFIIYALASNDETIDHLETLYETGSLKDQEKFLLLKQKLIRLGKSINNFLQQLQKTRN